MMEGPTAGVTMATEDFDYDSFDDQYNEPPTERWAPLGQATSPAPSRMELDHENHVEQLERLEKEQEQLNSSLLALTTHFAQVQFRLKQIVNSEPEQKEVLLKELEEFAFKGIPDVRGSRTQDAQILEEMSDKEHEEKITEQREKQRELIQQLKSQLEDLENYAYETGDVEELPTNKMMEKQRVVIEELRTKLDLNMENFDKLSTDDLKNVVDHAIGQIVNPAKVKEKLVDQLRTQVVDLERFIAFLQGEASSPGPLGKERCTCSVHKFLEDNSETSKECCKGMHYNQKHRLKEKANSEKNVKDTQAFVKKTLAILQMFIITQFGCGTGEFKRNMMKKTTKGNHWGDLRARLELAINKTLELAQKQEEEPREDQSEYDSDSEEGQEHSSPALTQCVRKDLAMAIRDLMQHGLMEIGQSKSLVPFGCLPNRSAAIVQSLHAWDLLLKFYEMKHGRQYNESPARKLSQSFHLEMVGGKPITAKQTLLGAIDTVISSHTPLKRSEDSHFKAFISMALNEKRLVVWMKLLFRTQTLIDNYYQDWSYVARTGNLEVWHGSVDIIIKNDLVVENLEKEPDSPGGKSPIEESSLSRNPQLIAETIVFSFLQKKKTKKKKHPELSHFLIPCVGIASNAMLLMFYDSEHDVFLESSFVPLLSSTCENMFSVEAILVTWLAVNYRFL
uniref:RUN domain-containing protein 1-like isoform X1 n=1 Tax=Crassostrea virginica TaxID=6565 RepID=A0A8B8EFQ3_CRAVI|nr:RUN domain-containing protein 1-like isoform X1 [Crassostrea virginica]XP_022338519.1 RUN domain-containing protein 1-like isoform X1 [Crassostrea virginica]XP_022338529.1 RUN domain-containing protein 1-like isoform X1 [Crassostrea virginica]